MVFAFGWQDDPRKLNYGAKALDGDPERVGPMDLTPDGGTNIWWEFSKDTGRPLDDKFMPTRILLEGPKAKLHDVWGFYGMFCVSSRFKEVVESLEPNVHQFFPVEVVWSDGSFYENMYLFNCCNRIDSVDREHTNMVLVNGVWNSPSDGEAILAFSYEAFEGRHIWKDKHLSMGTLITDKLATALKSKNIIVRLLRYDEFRSDKYPN